MASDLSSTTYGSAILDSLLGGEFVHEGAVMKRDPIIAIIASNRTDRLAVSELLKQSLECCAVTPAGKLTVLDQERLTQIHSQADDLRKRIAHNQGVLMEFDALYIQALADNPELEPVLFSLEQWVQHLKHTIERGENAIRVSAGTWLRSLEGSKYTPANIHEHPRVKAEIDKYQPLIDAAKKKLPVAEGHLEKAKAILGGAILPVGFKVGTPQDEFRQAISRTPAPKKESRKANA